MLNGGLVGVLNPPSIEVIHTSPSSSRLPAPAAHNLRATFLAAIRFHSGVRNWCVSRSPSTLNSARTERFIRFQFGGCAADALRSALSSLDSHPPFRHSARTAARQRPDIPA